MIQGCVVFREKNSVKRRFQSIDQSLLIQMLTRKPEYTANIWYANIWHGL